jgi:hypothetical protein
MANAKICRLCMQDIALEHTTTACPRCNTPYHSNCWEENPNCRYEQCPSLRNGSQPETATPAPAGGDGENYMDWVTGDDGNRAAAFYQGRQPVPPEQRLERLSRTSLPVRVKSGEFSEGALNLETANGRCEVSWDQVEFICLGVIEDQVGEGPANRSGLRNMVRKLFFGENNNEQVKRKTRDTYLLDVYVRGQEPPYRFEAINVNYRSFLGRVSYISAKNFLRLVARLASKSRESYLDASTVALLEATRERIRRYASVNDFELESTLHRERLDTQTKCSSLEIGRDVLGYEDRDLGEGDEAASSAGVPNHTKE